MKTDKPYKLFCENCKTKTDHKREEIGAEVYDICQMCFGFNNLRFEGFHTQDELYFRRLEDGSVMIFKREKNEFGNLETIFTQILDIDTWGSVVSSVSNLGEDYDRWMQAKEFHQELDGF